jgi:hypothetical protein
MWLDYFYAKPVKCTLFLDALCEVQNYSQGISPIKVIEVIFDLAWWN